MGHPRFDLEKGIVENGDVKEPLLHNGAKNNKFKRWKFKIKKDSDAQGSAATAIFCTAIVALGPLQFGYRVSVLKHNNIIHFLKKVLNIENVL